MKSKKTVKLYTDGSCSGNPGPGGWGAILIYKGVEKELSGGEENTTNNRMELTGLIKGLEALKVPCIVEVYTDSKYIVDAIQKGWLSKWRENNWQRTKKESVANVDLWECVLKLLEGHEAEFIWVKGHDTNEYNNRCDRLATDQTKKFAGNVPRGTSGQEKEV